MNVIETVRSLSLLHERDKMDFWEERKQVILSALPTNLASLTSHRIVGVGQHLASVFQLPHLSHDRSQGSLSTGGAIWTGLVSYYLNLCLAGTDAIAVSGKFIPECIKQSLKVTHSSSASTKLNSDIDIVILHTPGIGEVVALAGQKAIKQLSAHTEHNFSRSSAIVMQTKTNWNDNSQVPMLWNQIYKLARSGQIHEDGMAVGSGRFHISGLKGFGYAFATVPTQSDRSKFKPNSTPVVRVRSMTAGAYWGHPSVQGVMSGLDEFFNIAYNRTNHCFPSPQQIGVGYTQQLQGGPGDIDLQAFDLHV